MTRRLLGLTGTMGLVALLTSGCLIKDTLETWYVDASGAVRWSMLEKDVRSDANAPADRRAEENEYWLAVQQQRHPAAAGMLELGGAKLKTTVLQAEVPYTVLTEARFTGLDELGRRLLASIGAIGTSIVTRDAGVWTWTFTIRDPSGIGSVSEPSDGVNELTTSLNALRVVLTAGRFESAQGFELSSDRRVATVVEKEAKSGKPDDPVITFKLVWK